MPGIIQKISSRSFICIVSLNINTVLHSHIENGIRLFKEAGVNYQPKQRNYLYLIIDDERARGNGKTGYRIQNSCSARLRKKNIEDSLIGSATPHFNQDFQRFVWKMNDYQIDYAIYTKDILCPVLIITGKKDYAVGPDTYKTWHFKNSQVIFYDYAHVSFQEEPTWFT